MFLTHAVHVLQQLDNLSVHILTVLITQVHSIQHDRRLIKLLKFSCANMTGCEHSQQVDVSVLTAVDGVRLQRSHNGALQSRDTIRPIDIGTARADQFAQLFYICGSTFLPSDAMLARYQLSSCVCLSICLSKVGVVQRWLNLGSNQERRTIARGLQFSDAKDLGESTTSPQRGRQIEVGQVHIGAFPPISRNISETVQDRDTGKLIGTQES